MRTELKILEKKAWDAGNEQFNKSNIKLKNKTPITVWVIVRTESRVLIF